MRKIIKVHYKDVEEKLLNQVIETFYWLRDIKELQKKPSTSELLDWVRALQMSGVKVEKIHDDLPFLGVLLKKNQDIDVVWEIREKGYTRKGWGVLPG